VGKAYVIAKLMQSEIEVLHGETKAVLWWTYWINWTQHTI
jgi:hypothetical protein